jgi:hypothetical protein
VTSDGPSKVAVAGTWARRPEVLWRWVIDGVVLLLTDEDNPFVITGSGAVLWGLLDQPRSTTDVVAQLADLYGVDPAVVLRDIAPLLEELAARGGLERTL